MNSAKLSGEKVRATCHRRLQGNLPNDPASHTNGRVACAHPRASIQFDGGVVVLVNSLFGLNIKFVYLAELALSVDKLVADLL